MAKFVKWPLVAFQCHASRYYDYVLAIAYSRAWFWPSISLDLDSARVFLAPTQPRLGIGFSRRVIMVLLLLLPDTIIDSPRTDVLLGSFQV